MPLRSPLPALHIPLREKDEDVRLDLQSILDQAYRKGRYHLTIDYGEPPCQCLSGQRLDALISTQVLSALQPAALELHLAAAAVGLAVSEVEDMAEDATDRRAYRVQDTKRLIGQAGHDQNQRSPTSTVSPGPIGVPSGTMLRIDPDASLWVRVTRSRRARGEKPPAIATALSAVMLGT